MMLRLSLPPIDSHPASAPETKPSKVKAWLDGLLRQPSPVETARIVGDALAATNRVGMADSRRLEIATRVIWSLMRSYATRCPASPRSCSRSSGTWAITS